jgi:hypothetical protein
MSYKSDTCFSKHNNSPLTTYSSEDEAKNGADYSNLEYGNNLIPYECDNCNEWHLSPKNRSTQNTTCDICTDSNGNHKDSYLTKDDAQRRADILYEERDISLNVYKCEHNNGWHLTKR